MLKVGIIGMGVIANLNILGYINSPDTEVVAVADLDKKSMGKKLERWGLRITKTYTDYKKMVDHEDLDIVEILTPHHLHSPMTEYCAKANVPGISVQKPMAHTITDCEKMIDVCKDNNVVLKLYENFRFYPPYLKAKELLDNGIIGDRLNFRINTIGNRGPGMKTSLIKSYLWRAQVEKSGGGPWMYDDGQHKLSAALFLMNEERVESVYSWIDFYSGVMDLPDYMFFKYPSKNPDDPPKYGVLEITMSPNLYFPNNYYLCDEFIEISGTKGMMWINQSTAGGNFLSKTPQFPTIVVYTDGEVKTYGEDLPRDWRYSFINSTEHFINVMKKGGDPIYTGEQGKNLCIFGKMPHISHQQKRIVHWEEMTLENEQNKTIIVEKYFKYKNAITKGLKYLIRNGKDFKKGKKQGLENIKFKHEYEL